MKNKLLQRIDTYIDRGNGRKVRARSNFVTGQYLAYFSNHIIYSLELVSTFVFYIVSIIRQKQIQMLLLYIYIFYTCSLNLINMILENCRVTTSINLLTRYLFPFRVNVACKTTYKYSFLIFPANSRSQRLSVEARPKDGLGLRRSLISIATRKRSGGCTHETRGIAYFSLLRRGFHARVLASFCPRARGFELIISDDNKTWKCAATMLITAIPSRLEDVERVSNSCQESTIFSTRLRSPWYSK